MEMLAFKLSDMDANTKSGMLPKDFQEAYKIMKKQACIITAYKNVQMLKILLMTLTPYFECYVHIDKRKMKLFETLKDEFQNVKFISLYKVNWGGD